MVKATMTRERDIEQYLVRQMKAAGGQVRKVQWIGRRGAPDRLVMLATGMQVDGKFHTGVWVELKAPGEKPDAHQVREHKRMRDMGAAVAVIDSFEGVDALLPGDGA
jgi:hypothetical protein